MTSDHTGTILVVDDSPANIKLLTDMLTQWGHRVCAADDGLLALRMVKSARPDLVLLDVVMPNMDGFKVCQYLKASVDTRDIPVIFMTSLADTKDKVRGFRLGAADYITKPFQAEEVLARVDTLLALHALRKRLEVQNAELVRSNKELANLNDALGSQIAEHRKMELALHESEEQLRTLINAMPDIVAFKDGEGRWLEANDFDIQLFQLEGVDYRGKKDSELAAHSSFYREAFLGCEESDELAWEARASIRTDETIPRPNGPQMVFDVIKVPMYHPDGRRKGLVVVGRDVTERKRVEAELNRYQEQLEHLVGERTAALAEANCHLQAEIAERRIAEEKVMASLAEKEVLLKEVHHRVKNNLQIISTLLDLQTESIHDEHSLKSFRDSQDRIKAMALIHERLYQSRDLASINFAEYINNLAGFLFHSYVHDPEQIILKVDVGDVSLEIDQAIPCGLIINELISNCLKHAFPDGLKGEVAVICHTDSDGLVKLEVTDSGVGLPADLDILNTGSLGLQIVSALVKQLQGNIEMKCDYGASFVITFNSSLCD
ncbi:MAG: response regulator [Geobacteraceae bacterium]|nr:response regulator [Geobacteraceae bacterium]